METPQREEPDEEGKETGGCKGGEEPDDTSQVDTREGEQTETGWVQERGKREGPMFVVQGKGLLDRWMQGEREGFDVYGEVTASGGEELKSYVGERGQVEPGEGREDSNQEVGLSTTISIFWR